jgi:polysaccharide biosynthesis/export protein
MRKKPYSSEVTVSNSGATKRTVYAAVLVVSGFLAGHSFAQAPAGGEPSSPSIASQIGSASYSLSPSAPGSLATSTIDNAIDENAYYIGGGDRLHIYLVDMPSMNFSGIITQDYHFIEPTLGIIPIGGKVTLARAKTIIADFMQQKMKGKGHNQVRILFEGVKMATITIFGSVNTPGTQSFPGSMRLWDVLKSTTSGNMSDIDFREVRLKNRDSVAYFDILRFLYKGDFSQNPYIYPGDELFLVPATKRVYVGGNGLRAWISGQIPIHADECAKNFLSFFFFNENADSEHILIERTEDTREHQLITFNLKLNQDFHLKNYDVIMIPVKQDPSEAYIAGVSGEVVRPGPCPISKSGISVQTLIALAGGYTSFSDTNRTVILRVSKKPPPPGVADGISRPEMNGALAVAAATKDYLIIRIKEHPETLVKPGDNVFVPRMENTVYISGCVKYPGGYAFKPNQKKEYYVGLAGGFAERADKSNIAVITPYLDFYISKSTKAKIEAGDFIAVPLKREFKLYERIILPTLSMLLASAGFLVGIVSIIRR